jgi:hypothetical protein
MGLREHAVDGVFDEMPLVEARNHDRDVRSGFLGEVPSCHLRAQLSARLLDVPPLGFDAPVGDLTKPVLDPLGQHPHRGPCHGVRDVTQQSPGDLRAASGRGLRDGGFDPLDRGGRESGLNSWVPRRKDRSIVGMQRVVDPRCRGNCESPPQFGIAEQPVEGGHQTIDGPVEDQGTGALGEQPLERRQVGDDHRQPRPTGLMGREAEALESAGDHDRPAVGQEAG